MNIKHILILIIFTISYANKTTCMLPKPIRESNTKIDIKTEKHKSDSRSSESSSNDDYSPLVLRGELKSHAGWVIRVNNSKKK